MLHILLRAALISRLIAAASAQSEAQLGISERRMMKVHTADCAVHGWHAVSIHHRFDAASLLCQNPEFLGDDRDPCALTRD
jgi:hypothetical protein